MQKFHKNFLRLILLKITLMGMGTLTAASRRTSDYGDPSGARSVSDAASFLSARTSVAGGPTHAPEIDIPREGIIYYVPYSQDTPFPWSANNGDLLRIAIEKSALGNVPDQAPNVFYVSDEWADNLRIAASGLLAELYYIIDGDPLEILWKAPQQKLLHEAIKDSGTRHAPHKRANVFLVKKEWEKALARAGCEKFPLMYVVDGEEPFETKKHPIDKDLIKEAILASGSRRVTMPGNVFYITKEWGLRFNKEVRDALEKAAGKKLYIVTTSQAARDHSDGKPAYVYSHYDSALTRKAIENSNISLVHDGNVFYVSNDWMEYLLKIGMERIPYPEDSFSCCIQ